MWDVFTGQEIKTITNIIVIGFDISPASKYIVSNSFGDEFTVYDVATANKIRTFKSRELAAEFVDSLSISQDGRYGVFAKMKWDVKRSDITILDMYDGKRIFTMQMDGNIFRTEISPDGKFGLAAGDKGLKLLDIRTGKEIRTFTNSSTSSALFSPDSKYIISSGYNYAPTLWDVSTGNIIVSFVGRPRLNIFSIAVSPDGKFASSGKRGKVGAVGLFNIFTGRVVKIIDVKGHAEYIGPIAVSSDLKYALSGEETVGGVVKLWDLSTGEELKTFKFNFDPDPPQSLYCISFSSDNRYAVLGFSQTILLLDIDSGEVKKKFDWGMIEIEEYFGFGDEPKLIKMKMPLFPASASFSPDGQYIVFTITLPTKTDKGRAIVWDIQANREVKTFEGASAGIFSPDSRYLLYGEKDAIKLWDIRTKREVKVFEGELNTEIWREKLAFSPDGRYILAALKRDEKAVTLYELVSGREIKTFKGHSTVTSFRFLPDGRHIISGDHEGARLWDISTGKEIAQFISFTDGEWVIITPEGYFNASPNGAKHLNVRVGNSVYSIDNFYEKFFNPVYVASVLQGRKIETVADIRKGILTPPDVKITSPEPNTSFSTDTVTITVSAKDTGGGIDEIRLYHNGKAIGEDIRAVKIVSKGNEVIKNYTVTLVDGLNTFRAIGFSKDRTESNPYELLVKLTAPSKDVSMYIFAVGINKYKNPALNLNYAEPDAKGIADFFKQKGNGLFKNVEIKEIYNEQATKEIIISRLSQLQNTNPQDAVLIYLAGHGENINDKWYFIPHELTYPEREEDVKTKGISSDELSGLIKNIKAQKILLLIDSCKSGAVLIAFRGFEDRKALSQLSRSTGVHIVAASTKDQFAAEVKELGHGVFTYTLLEGLKGKAAGKGETVTVRKLMGYIEEQLPDITKKYKQEAQFPVVDSRGMDFPLTIVK